MRGSFGLVVLPLAGCAQLGGIDKTNGDNRRVTLEYDRLSVGAKASTAPLALTGLTAAFLVPDPMDESKLVAVPADPDVDGLWAAKILDGTPPVLFTLPDGATYLWQLPSRTMHGAFVALEHPGPTPAPAGASIDITSTLDAPSTAGESFAFLEIGTWAQQALTVTPPAAAIAQTFPYAGTINLAAPLPLAAITSDDALLVMRHTGNALTGIADFTPTGVQGTTVGIATPVTAVARDQTFAMPIEPVTLGTRFSGQKPAGGALALSFSITAAPGFASGVVDGPSLLTGAIPVAATSVAGTYGNPFAASRMWPAALSVVAARSRVYSPAAAGGPSITLGTSLSEVIAPDGATPISLAASLPAVITVGITPLNTDGTSVLIDASKPVPVSFTTDNLPASLYELQLFELTPSGATFTQTLRLQLAGDTPSWMVPQGFLLPAHTYLFRAAAIGGGFGDLTTGDLSTLAPPYSVGLHDGGVFTVTL